MRFVIKDLFRLVHSVNESDVGVSRRSKKARLALTRPIDYERLQRPNETHIRVEIACLDDKYESLGKIVVQVNYVNDNEPRFAAKNMTSPISSTQPRADTSQ